MTSFVFFSLTVPCDFPASLKLLLISQLLQEYSGFTSFLVFMHRRIPTALVKVFHRQATQHFFTLIP